MAAKRTAVFARKWFVMMFGASAEAVFAITNGVQSVRKGYTTRREGGVLNALRATGLSADEHLVDALKRLFFLMVAGYKHELQAAATLSARRLTDIERSSVPLDVVYLLGGILCEESLKYGDFQKNSFLQDFRNKYRMGKDHYDRDSIAHDIYFSVLLSNEDSAAEWEHVENCFREAVTRTVEWAAAKDLCADGKAKAAYSIFLLGVAVKTHALSSAKEMQMTIKMPESSQRSGGQQQTPSLTEK